MVFFNKSSPQTAHACWVAPTATVIGDVWLYDFSNIWYGAVVRGDKNTINIGAYTNIQDGAVITTDDKPTLNGFNSEVTIGNYVTVGHGAKLHACKVGDRCIIGMGATVLEGAIVEHDSIVASGSVVAPNRRIPSGELWAGNPARFVRKLSKAEMEPLARDAKGYHDLAMLHDVEFTAVGMHHYKEVEQLAQSIEQRAPPTDDRPMYWNTWDKMGLYGKSPFPNGKDRSFQEEHK